MSTLKDDLQKEIRARKALGEIKKRKETIAAMKADSFPPQWKFITDKAKLKAALTTRRSGKSMGDALYLLKEGMLHPGCSMLYTGLTDDSAWRILWKDCLKPAGKKYKINLKPVKSDYQVELRDYGSMIYLMGVDSNPEEMSKAFGQKFKLVIIDEAALYKQDMRMFVHDVLLPAVADYEGTICLTGMPSNNVRSFFNKVTTGQEGGWSVHKWTFRDNPYVSEKLKAQVDFLVEHNPGIEKTPGFKQHYKGEWCVDEKTRIYNYDRDKWGYDTLPQCNHWHYVLGVDLGYNDPTAFVIVAYRDYDPNLYVVEAYKRKNMTISEVATRIKHYERFYKVNKIIIDNSAKQAVEELKQRHSIPLTPADKAGKVDFIQLCNDDLIAGRVRVRNTGCTSLTDEWDVLIWYDKALLNKGIYAEPPRAVNHCSDAFLYAWRYCYNWVDRGVAPKTIQTAEQAVEEWWSQQDQAGGHVKEHGIIGALESEFGIQE